MFCFDTYKKKVTFVLEISFNFEDFCFSDKNETLKLSFGQVKQFFPLLILVQPLKIKIIQRPVLLAGRGSADVTFHLVLSCEAVMALLTQSELRCQ